MYDEAIEVYGESDEEVSPNENASNTGPHRKTRSPFQEPLLSSREQKPPPLALPSSFSRPTMKEPGEEKKKLSSQDFIPNLRPTGTNHRGVSSSLSQDQTKIDFSPDTPRPNSMATEMPQGSSVEKELSPSSSGVGKKSQPSTPAPPPTGKTPSRPESTGSNDNKSPRNQKPGSSEDDDDDDYDEETNMAQIEGVYNPSDYANLSVSPEIKDIFQYITQYQLPPLSSQVDVKLHPFIPEYYPSVGDIDAFIKVVDPEVTEDGLGVKCLDEPAPFQSDPSVLDLRLRALAKQSSAKAVVVKKVENVGKNSKIIDNWIKDISDLHRSKPSPSVHYSKPMPDIDTLLQEWPPEMEEVLKNHPLPSPDLNCSLETYVDIVCNILDIPVYKSRIQSLHVLFTLYATQKQFNNQLGSLRNENAHRGMKIDADSGPSSATGVQTREDNYDRLQLS